MCIHLLIILCRPPIGAQPTYGATTDEEYSGEEEDSLIITVNETPPVNKRADHATSSVTSHDIVVHNAYYRTL